MKNWIMTTTRLVTLSLMTFFASSLAHAEPFAYITNTHDGTVSVIDTATDTVVGPPISVGSHPGGVAVNPAGTRAYVANHDDSSVSVIDTATNTVVKTIVTGLCGPAGVAVNPAGTAVYVTNNCDSLDGTTVSVIDANSNSVITMIKVGFYPAGIAINPTGSRVYVANTSSNSISVIDAGTNSVWTTIPMPDGVSIPVGVAVNPAGTLVYVTNDWGTTVITVIDAASNTVLKTIPNAGYGIALSPDGTRLYTTSGQYNNDYLLVIDTATDNVIKTISTGCQPMGVAVNPAGTRVYVADYCEGNGNTVDVFDTATNSVVDTIAVGNGANAFGRFIGPGTATPATVPTVATAAIRPLSLTTASGGGTVSSSGGSPVTARGVCWGASANPAIGGNCTSEGTGIGAFTSAISGLTTNTAYHARAYATNAAGTGYGNDAPFILSFSGDKITEFPIPTISSTPFCITAGPDGASWFTEGNGNRIGRITTAGAISEFPALATANSGPVGITSGPDGNLWFTEGNGNRIGRITTAGEVTEFPVLPTAGSYPRIIVAGPDGNLWFTESNSNKIGRITTSGTLTEYTVPGSPYGIAAGPDGNLWFTEESGNKIGKITTTGSITEYPIPTAASAPHHITAGPDGNVWFTEYSGNKIGRITTDGTLTEFSPLTAAGSPHGITRAPDGNIWFTEAAVNKIGRITTAGVVTELPVPTPGSNPRIIAAGPDGNLWFTDSNANLIGKLTLFASIPTVTTAPLSAITMTTAAAAGNVTNDGGATVTGRGVCWGTSANPTIADSHTSDGTGTGSFTSSITGLSPDTPYHLRSYATNAAGTAYGADLQFTTPAHPATPPSVTTDEFTGIASTTAAGGGTVTDDGGATVSARGLCWGISVNPATAGSHTSKGTGTGTFNSAITGLSPYTSYHVRAYATNSVGTAYGGDISFTTNLCTSDVKIGAASYETVQEAVNSGSGEIMAVTRVFQEGLLFAGSGNLTLHGGYDCAFTASTGFTTVDGSITIAGSAVVIMSNIAVY